MGRSKSRANSTTAAVTHPTPPTDSKETLYQPEPIELWCFVCNSKYFTSVIPDEISEGSKSTVLTLCNLFGISDERDRQQMLRLSILSDPFCIMCTQKMGQIQDWATQLELLQKGIEDFKTDLSQSIVHSFPDSPNIEGTHPIKAKMVKYCTTSAASTINTNDLELQLFGQLVESPIKIQTEIEEHILSTPIENEDDDPNDPIYTPNSDDLFFEVEVESSTNSQDMLASPKEKKKQNRRKETKKSPNKKPSRPRSAPVRQDPKQKIQAHPDGHCRLCPSRFGTQVALAKHIRRAHSGITYQCRYCEKLFRDTSNRSRHESGVHTVKTRDFICEICGKDYKSKPQLREHKSVAHEGKVKKGYEKVPQQCQFCGHICSTPKYLMAHIRMKHKDPKFQPCTICGRPFRETYYRKVHERTHMSAIERNKAEGKTFFYKCSICPKEGQIGYNLRALLQLHYEDVHPNENIILLMRKAPTKPVVNERRFFCTECPFLPGFTRKLGLTQHINSGHGKLLFGRLGRDCKICKKPCRDATRALFHEETHKPRRHCCHTCPTETQSSWQMKDHYTNVHPGISIPESVSLNFRKNPYLRYFCTKCPNHPGFQQKSFLQRHITNGHPKPYNNKKIDEMEDLGENSHLEMVKEDELEENDNEGSENQYDQDSEESDHEKKFTPMTIKKRPTISTRGRIIKPPNRYKKLALPYRPIKMEPESKELFICLERIDSKWPKGRVKRVVKLEGFDEIETNPIFGTMSTLKHE